MSEVGRGTAVEVLPGRTVPPGAWRCAVLLALLCFVTCAYFHLLQGGWNENTRLALTYAVCFDRSFHIDAYHRAVVPTSDKAVYGGHFYTDKAPGSSFWAVPACAVETGVRHLVGMEWSVLRSRYVIRLLALSLPAALFLLLFWRLAFALTGDLAASLWATAVYGLGTQALPYATVYLGHLLAGMFCFAAFALAFALRHGLLRRRRLAAALAGLALGLAVLTEYQTALIGVVVLVYLLVGLRSGAGAGGLAPTEGRGRGEVAAVLLAGLVPVAVLGWYNTVCFGSPFRLGYMYEYLPIFRQYMAWGATSVGYPHLTVLYGVTVSKYRGLFFVSPVLVLGLYGWWLTWREGRRRAEALVVAAVVLVYFTFVCSIHVDQWDGGSSFGPRFLIPMVPFLALPVVHAYRRQKPLFFALTAVSIAVQFMATAVGPQPHESIVDPVFEDIVPLFVTSDFSSVANWGSLAGLGGALSLLPLYVSGTVGGVILVRWALIVQRREREADLEAPLSP